jgi:pimeloyl-ACP methyl ester carboxylesterase
VADLPGYGDSSPPTAPTLDALVDATRQSLDALLGANTPILLGGFSFGGLVAAQLAARRGAVRALALLGAAGHGSPRRPRGELIAWRGAWECRDDAALREIMRTNLERHMLAGPASDEAVAIHTEACVRTRFKSKRISLSGGLQEALASLPCPQWLLWGEHDVTATPQVLVTELAARLANAHVEVLPDAGHWVQYEAADRVNAMLLPWLRAQGHAAT